jgi:putative acetyltransferase
MHIRIATTLDQDEVRGVHLSAFPEGERGLVSTLAVNLLAEQSVPQTFSLVAESEGAVVGHVCFSPVTIETHANLQGYILAPLAIKPDYQNRHIGSQLIEDGMQRLSAMEVDILFVYGDPAYYSRFGFGADAAARYTPPYPLQYPFGWQGIALNASDTEGSPVNITCVSSLCDPVLW